MIENAAPAAGVNSRPRLPYDTTTPTAAGAVTIRAEADAGVVLLKLSRWPHTGVLITDDEARCLALHLVAAVARARDGS